jgi:hypothetical protein
MKKRFLNKRFSFVRRMLRYLAIIVGMSVGIMFILTIPHPFPREQVYGVTFSQPHATGIGLDWQEAYDVILEDLGVKHLRLSAYWETIEPEDGVFDFEGLDYQMDKAAEHRAQVILGVGRKLPRWPECHVPEWAQRLPEPEQQQRVLDMMKVVIERYAGHTALRMWQLENEPLLDFGICPPEDREFLRRQEELIRSLGGDYPILVTDSGELSSWLPASTYGDIFCTTMYRTVFSENLQSAFHYDYIFPAWNYRIRARLLGMIRGKDVIISELQGEPWIEIPWLAASQEERENSFSPERFLQIQRFARRTQLPEAYWWGVEYWYWEKVMHDDDRYWEIARSIWSP